MENDSPNLFDSEPVSVQLTVVDNHDDDILAKEIREFGDEVQQQNTVDEYRTDESDDENKDNGDTDKNQLAAHVEKSVKEVGIEDSIKTAKDVQHKGLPPGRVKLIMKMDPDVNIIAREAVYLVTKATESFIGLLTQHCHKAMVASNKKTLQKKHIDSVIEDNVPFEFLEGALDW